MKTLITSVLDNESLVLRGDYLRDALLMREYAAYAALILMVLPSLRELRLADFNCASLDHLHTILHNLNPGSDWNRRHASDPLLQRISSISAVSFNVDDSSGVAYPRWIGRFSLEPLLNLSSVKELSFSIPDGHERRILAGAVPPFTSKVTIRPEQMMNITSIVIRHSDSAFITLESLLRAATQLRSLTYDFFYDCKEREDVPARWLDLSLLNEILPKSLQTLVMGVENCNTTAYPFKQPRFGEKLYGYLDLTGFANLHTLEVPFPFLTGDADFSITTEIYPLLPPNLQHLSLRTDMSLAQHQFPFDTSLLSSGLTFQESEDEARHLLNARMDVSYMFHAAMMILDFTTTLETISVWQPADASLSFFEGQVTDFAQTCRNKSIKGHLLYPMLLRWKKAEHWNLIKETTVHDPQHTASKYYEVFHRGQRAGIPLGLAAQYHLHALRSRQVRIR